MADYIDRQAAIDAAIKMFNAWYGGSALRHNEIRARFEQIPSAEVIPVEYISQYQQKMRKLLKGRYFPDETIGWLIKDWRIDSERKGE